MIGQVLGYGQIILRLTQALSSGSNEDIEKAERLLSTIGSVNTAMNTNSVSTAANKLLIAPIVAIENTLIHQEYMNDLMVVVNLRDIKDVLGHLAMQCTVDGISVSDIVGAINPNRGGMLSLHGLEAWDPSAAINTTIKTIDDVKSKQGDKDPGAGKMSTSSSKTIAELNESGALAVGRTVEAQVTINGKTLTFPLTFRQCPMPVSTNDIELMFTAAKPKDGFFARIFGWRAGEYTTPELITGVDEIKDEFRIRNNDMSGYYNEVTRRADENKAAAMRTGVISMNTMANTIIISSETARRIEIEIGRTFDSSGINQIRKAVLANTIIVVDENQGIFKFYTGAARQPERYTRKEITVKSKKENGIDLQSLLKLFGGR